MYNTEKEQAGNNRANSIRLCPTDANRGRTPRMRTSQRYQKNQIALPGESIQCDTSHGTKRPGRLANRET